MLGLDKLIPLRGGYLRKDPCEEYGFAIPHVLAFLFALLEQASVANYDNSRPRES